MYHDYIVSKLADPKQVAFWYKTTKLAISSYWREYSNT